MRRVPALQYLRVSKCAVLLLSLVTALATSTRDAFATGDLRWSALATSDNQPVSPDTLRSWIEAGIAKNQASPPPGNPGPFTQGYRSMVFALGQCYGGQFDGLTFMGPKIIVASATDETSTAEFIHNNHSAYYRWARELARELTRGANRPAKAIFDKVRAANPDPDANTPEPSTSTNGETVKLGNAANEPNTSYHAVIFGGKEDTGGPGTEGDGQNRAARAAIDSIAAALTSAGNVPAANIKKRFPGTKAELKGMIDSTLAQLNDNEQFIFIAVDHGTRETLEKAPVVPDPETEGQQSYVPGPEEDAYYSPDVIDPSIMLESAFVLTPATVRLNGTDIGTLAVSAGYSLQRVPYAPELLLPFPALNRIQILADASSAPVSRVGFSTGPVHSGELLGGPVPGASATGLALSATALLLAGVFAFRRRRSVTAE
jgi:hypothetical protein